MRTVVIRSRAPVDPPFRVVPVLDVRAGVAVHAVGGLRAHYRPLRSCVHDGSDPVGVARAYRDVLGLRDLYLADLDAIAGLTPDFTLYRELSLLGLDLWVDAGLRDGAVGGEMLRNGVSTIVAGSETLMGPTALGDVLDLAGPERVVFSLDLEGGLPLLAHGAAWPNREPPVLAAEVVRRGVRRLLLLDLTRVGRREGPGTGALLSQIAREHPSVELVVGGGVRDAYDLREAHLAGAAAALVGSALHAGTMTRETIATLEGGC